MKKQNVFSNIQLLLILFAFAPKVHSQCNSTYTTSNYFCDLDSLFLTAVPLEGVGPFSFIWETGDTSQTIMIPLALGDYMFTVTDANGCTIVNNAHVKPFPEVLFYPYAQDACEGDTVTLWLDWFRDSIPGATYLWSTGETTPTIELTDDLVWSVTVTDPSNGCEFIIPPGLFDFHPTPPPQIVGPNMLCNGSTITLSVTGGPFGGIVWYLPSGEPHWAETLDVTEPGMYIVWGSSMEANYCWGKDTIEITEGNITPPLLSGPPELCDGQTGTISVTNYTFFEEFIWSNGMTSSSFTANAPGTYTVTVTDNGGCTSSASITVANASPNVLTVIPTAATCGQSNGSIDLSYSISGSYVFEWSNGATTQNIDDVPSGIYSVTVTDPDGCFSTIETTVPDTEISININENITPNNSCDQFNGAIDLLVTPAVDYIFLWSNGETTEDIQDLAQGTYYVTITHGLTCITTEVFFVEDISAAPDLTSSTTPATCGETNGSIDLQLSGGSTPFAFIWSNGATTEDLNNLPAGTYTVTVTAADGCTANATITVINNNPPISINAIIEPNTSCNGSNGSIDITVSPNDNYTFEWSTGANTEDISGLGAGTYIVIVQLGGCSEQDTFSVTSESLPFNITGISSPNTSCISPNGSIDLSLSPAGTYTFLWSNGSSNEDLPNLGGGTYTVTVTNSDGCSISSTFNVENQNSPFSISGISVANTSCQVPNGSLNITVMPPGTYSFIWSTGSTTEDLQNIAAGTFDVTVTNADGCTATSSFTIVDQTTIISISATTLPNNSCTILTGSIDLSVDPSGIYTFLWSNGEVTEDLQSLNSGSYIVTVTDQNSCSATSAFTVDGNTSDPVIIATITHETCGAGNGMIDLNITPAASTLAWSNGETSEDLVNLSAGSYIVIVTGTNGCTTTDTFDILNTNNSFSLSAIPTDNTSCISPNGSLDLLVTPSGMYSFVWSTGAITEDIFNLVEGTYSVTVVDNMNCASTSLFSIQSNTIDPVISQVITPAICGQPNGNISLTIIPSAGNTYLWSDGSVSQNLQNLISGFYAVTVTGSNGCSAVSSFIVPDNNSNLQISGVSSDNQSCISPEGSVDLTITPSGSYTFAWSHGASTPDLQNLPAGIYVVTVTDQFNCSSTETFIVLDQIIKPLLSQNITPASCGQSNGAIDLIVSLTNNNTFLWSNGNTSEDLINALPGIYQVTVSSEHGCTAVANIEIPNQNSNFSISSTVSDDNSCTNPTGSVDVTITPAGNYTFSWSNGASTEDLSNLPSGIYEVTVTDQFNCSSTEIFTVENTTTLPLLSAELSTASCGQSNGSIDLTVIPSSGNQFLWSTGDTSEDLNNLSEGVYNVIVTDLNGCSTQEDYLITGTTPLILELEANLTSVGVGETVICSLEINVPLAMVDRITWSPDIMMSCHDPICTEQIIILMEPVELIAVVTDTNGCSGTARLRLDIAKEFKVYIPNVFTPNSDGPNDMFTVYTNDEVKEVVTLEIFDRWGNCVFINTEFPPNEPRYGWDGIYRGLMMNPDVFAYRAVVRYSNGEEHSFKGDVTLVR